MKAPPVVVLMESSRGWERGLITGIAKYSHLNGPWNFLKKPAFFLESKTADFYSEIVRFNPDGIIMREVPDAEKIIDLGKPTVISPHMTCDFSGVATIIEHCTNTGKMAAEHLLGKGLKHFAYCGLDDFFWSQRRCAGFVKRIEKEGMTVSVYKQPAGARQRKFENEKPVLGKCKRECLNHFVCMSLDQLDYINREWLAYYNNHRPHQGREIGNKVLRPDFTPIDRGEIYREQCLGGIISWYYREAA